MNETEFERLLAAVCDGRASDEEVTRFEDILHRDEAARDRYLAFVDLHACLSLDSVGEDAAGRLEAMGGGRSLRWSRLGWWRTALAVVAAGLAAVWMVWAVVKGPSPAGRDCLAVVTNADGALWGGEDASVMIGTGVGRGVVELCEGRVELEMDTGVKMALEGRARFELLSLNRAILHEGMLSASVPPEAIGFTVETPAMAVVDLGTQFGVNVNSTGEAEVHVFDGEVEAILKNSGGKAKKQILTENRTLKAARHGRELEPVVFHPGRFAEPPRIVEGVEQVWGGIRTLRYPPESVREGTYQHNYILLFPEQRQVELEDPLEVSVVAPGSYRVGFQGAAGDQFRQNLGPGVRVDSYFLHYDTKTSEVTTRRGTVRFARPIVAVIAEGAQLARTDGLLGSCCTAYDRERVRKRELEADNVIIGGDRRTLTVNWHVGAAADQIRVLVEAGP